MTAPILPTIPTPYPNDWAIAALPVDEIAAREQARVQLMGSRFGVQPEDVLEIAPAPEPPSLRDQLLAFTKGPAGPAPASTEQLAKIAADRQAARLVTQRHIRQEIESTFTRSAQAAQAVQAIASEYRMALQALRLVSDDGDHYLRVLPAGEASRTLVTRCSRRSTP